ncbi:protein FANTASTIC FOUR 3-like [Hibiscus syriacus]|uniref:protein FANTASTIC FOUR 3-like n=1 Tax=Hibiscus syriacus TaxID=106335 RepID=UPI001922FCA9|nr:protein FANTASTIC FOUR 3-like [Hibiscus syriacus]
MATIVCHHHHHRGLQSCLESHTVEPRALRLMLSPSIPHFSPSSLELVGKSFSINPSPEPGGWNLLQALFDGPRPSKEIEGNENTYVRPSSDKNLELCTENLGSETGSDDVLGDDDDIFSSSSSSRLTRKQHESRRALGCKKVIGGDFPPPLMTISGSESIRVCPHRENGRLVMKAEKAPSYNSIFRAERSNGRLRLSIFKDSTSSIDYKEETTTGNENDNKDNNTNNNEEEEFENDRNAIADEDEFENKEEPGTTKIERREGRGGGNGAEGGAKEVNMKNKGWLNWVATSIVLFWICLYDIIKFPSRFLLCLCSCFIFWRVY